MYSEIVKTFLGAKRTKRGPAQPEPQRPAACGAWATAESAAGFQRDETEGLAFVFDTNDKRSVKRGFGFHGAMNRLCEA